MEREFYYSKDGTKVMVVAPVAELEDIIGEMNHFKYKYDHMLVIGNGFDLNLGLATRYSDFVKSNIFKKMYEKRIQEKEKKQPSLIDYLYGKSFCERWYDIELSLFEYVSRKPDGGFVNNVEIDRRDHELLCESLVEYLTSLFKTGDDLKQSHEMQQTSSGQLLQNVNSERSVLYSFNYTPINLIINAVLGSISLKTKQVHGEIKEESIFKGVIKDSGIVLGIEVDDINSIAPGYSFLIKSNNLAYKSTNLALDLLYTRNVILFGHSLNQMDFGYLCEYFMMMASNRDNERILTIITKDKESRVSLLDNIRKMGISVRDICAHTKVEYILTDNIDVKDSKDAKLFNGLLERLELSY
ncbi:MAG: hypothetical protein IJ190_12435 [Prevotella sp.]|nr:hypothetical protein [Prevotella sp.]